MSVVFKLKRSNTPGHLPNLNDIELGELTVNTADGKVFFKQDDQVTSRLVTLQEYTSENLLVDNTSLSFSSSSSTLQGVLEELDNAIPKNINDLDDVNVDTQTLSLGDTLIWNGGNWVASGDGSSSGIALSPLAVKSTNQANEILSTISNVSDLRFDTDSGFDVVDLGGGAVKIQMNSTFKTWKVEGQDDLVATGLDTVEFVAGQGITITTDPNASLYKTITISAAPADSTVAPSTTDLLGVIIDFDIDADGDLILTHVDTFTEDNVEINDLGYFILSDGA